MRSPECLPALDDEELAVAVVLDLVELLVALDLFSGPGVFVAHDLASAVACRGADQRQGDAPPAASLRHDLTRSRPLKTGDRPVPRRWIT
jgi:hypothetical protein